MLKQALLAPVRSSDALPTLLIGSAMVLLATVVASAVGFLATRTLLALALAPLAVLFLLVLLGYELRVVGAGVRGERGTPSFVDWSGLVRGGVASLAVTLGYLLPAVVLAGGAYALSVGLGDGAMELPRSTLASTVAGYGGAGLLGLYGLLLLPLRSAALSVYAATGRLRSAFAVRRVLGVVATSRFLLGWALGSLVVLVGLVVFPLAFYARVTAHSLYGRAAAPRLDARSDDASPREAGPGASTGGDLSGGDAGTVPGPIDLDGERDDTSGPDAGRAPDRSLDAYEPDELRVAPDDADAGRLADPGAAFASFDPGTEEADDAATEGTGGEESAGAGAGEGGSGDEDGDGDGDDGFRWGRVE